MNADERDQIVDQALKHAFAPGEPAPASAACLDAETLAAWMDDGLDPGALAMAEAHASACERCQALLGAMVKTLPAAAGVAAAPATPWRWWFAPLAAGLAATTLWMVIPGSPPQSPPEITLARAPAESEAAAAPARDRAPSPEAAQPALRQNAPAADVGLRKEAPPVVEEAKREAEAPAASGRANALAERAELKSAEVQAPTAAAAPAAADRALGLAQQQAPVLEIVSPDPAARWLVHVDGALERSTDAGQTWAPAGSAPTARSPSPRVNGRSSKPSSGYI